MDDRRLADVRAGVADGYRSLGSGYVIAPRLVLTARHVVLRGETSSAWPRIIVRVGHPRPGSRAEHSATVAWAHPERDAAVLLLDEPVPVSGPVRWAQPAGRKPLPYEAIGFPEATVKADGRRQPEHLRGTLPVLTGGNGPDKNYALDQDVAPAEPADGEKAWAGASGSAVFCYNHLVGVAIHDDDAFANRRLHACPAHTFVTHPGFIDLMERHAEVPLLRTVSADEPPDAQAEHALGLLLRLSEGAISDADVVAKGPDEELLTLSDGMYVSRHVEADILRRLDEGKVTLVVGEAGHGKTTLLWGLHHKLNAQGRQPVLVRASDLLAGLRREGRSTAGISLLQLHAALPELAQSEERPVLLLDTLDLLLHSDDTRNVVVELLTSLVRLRIPTVVTCRPVEATLLRTTGVEDQLPNRRVNLLSYDDEECRAAVHAYSRHFYAGVQTFTAGEVANSVLNAASRGRALREVCANPFALRLLFEVYAPDKPDEDVDTPRLYDEYWHKRIRSDQRAWRREEAQDVDLSGFAESTARLLLAFGRLDITRPELEARLRDMEISGPVGVSAAIDLLRTRGVFTLRRQVNRLWFFHQTFFEHAAARGVLSCGAEAVQELLDRVKQDPGDLFFGEVASEVLLMADRWSATGSDPLTGLLGPWLASDRPALVSLALPVYAKLKHPDTELVALGRATLERAEPNDVRRFLTMLPSVVHPDPGRPFGDLAIIWNRPDSEPLALRRPLLEALIRLAATNTTEAWRFLQDHACLNWLRERPVDNRGYNEYPYTAVLSAVAAADPNTVLDEALAFAARLAEAGNGGGLTDLTLGIIGWCHTPRLASRAAKGVLTALEQLNPKMTSLGLERAYARLFLLTRPKAANAARAVSEAFKECQDRRASPLSRRAVLRGWTAAVMQADETHVSEFLSACLSTRKPHQQVAVCNAVLTEALIGQPDRFTRTPLAAPVWGSDENATVSPLTAQVIVQCKEALGALPCPHKDPDGAKRTPWLMRRALQDADLPDIVLRDLLPVVAKEAAERYWLTSDACCVFLVDAAAGGHPQAEHMLHTFLTDPDVRQRVTALTIGQDSVTRIGGDLQRKVTTHPHLIDDLLPYADSTNQPALVQQAVRKLQKADPSTARAWFTSAQWSRLVDYRERLVKHSLPHIRRQGYMLWSALLDVGVDVHPQATEITEALKSAAAQALREALLGLAEDTVRARRWGTESVPLMHDALQPIIEEGARRRAEGTIKGKAIAQEATARRVMAQTYANLGDLEDAYDVAEALLSLVTDSGYDVADEAQRGFLSRIMEPYGFLIDRMTDHNVSWAAELLVMAAEALQEVQPDGAKWKREIARTWTGTVLRLTEGLKEVERHSLARTLMKEPTLATSVLVETVDKADATPAWVRGLLDDPAVPSEVRTRLHGTLLLHSRQGHAHSGWPELLRYRLL